MGNIKTPHKTSTHANFHDVNLDGPIKDISHQFYFGVTPNGPSKNDLIEEDHHNDNDGDTTMIPTNIYKRYKVSTLDIRKLLSNPNPYSTHGMKDLTIYGKLYFQVTTAFVYAYTNNRTHDQ